MNKKLIAVMLLAGSSLFAKTHFSIGIGIGGPAYYAPAPVVVARPPCPGPGYSWVNGYYDPYGAWVTGYWAAPVGGYYYRGGFDRDDYRWRHHRDWDHDRDRDHDRGRHQGFRDRR